MLDPPERLVGVDFGGPRAAKDQRRKIVAIVGMRLEQGRYAVRELDNVRLVGGRPGSDAPGFSALELADELLTTPARVVALDFPFSVSRTLLTDPAFAAPLGCTRDFGTWRKFNEVVSSSLWLEDPLDFSLFLPWRDRKLWQLSKRSTDRYVNAHPPLKDKFQNMFQMTLLGNVVLGMLSGSELYAIVPFDGPGPAGEVIEVYPSCSVRSTGVPFRKSAPAEALGAMIDYCALAGVTIEVDVTVRAFCERYSTSLTGDFDAADALIALITAILYREGRCVPAIDPERLKDVGFEGVTWQPAASSRADSDVPITA